ncbi:histidine phosphatase family protein [Patescibacteria group bacterium]|nr:histidine phosphatase family protein [Patescibacteria group bacterium]
MKEIYILRHAEKDVTGELTKRGKVTAAEQRRRLGHFDCIYSSDKPRVVETAILLTGNKPVVDTRAGAIPLTPEEKQDENRRYISLQ